MDRWGDHLVSCKLNQPQQRHNTLRDALAYELKNHNIAVLKEVTIGGGKRPADLGLPNFDSRGPTAIDLVVHHPLSLSENRTAQLARSSLRTAETHKINEAQELCNSNGWLFSPMGWHAWGGVGPFGSAIRSRLEKEIAGDLQGWPRRNLIQKFRANLTFALMHFVAKQLRAAEDAVPQATIAPDLLPPRFQGGPIFTPQELAGWDEAT